MSGGGVENNWRLGGGMDIFLIFLIIRFYFLFFKIFSSSYTLYGLLQFKVLINLFVSGHEQF